eukprot:TRINITY_DN2614_c0_g1_i3.p3 TRINITY_DN2614_c0_g1~~TRINITY_DN2614_c0_g1_i3.p3  ORF type:complete len:626 (+),score=82.21 TRINITY_DN2614_c0_g1_i3:14421-16298(+)
MIYNIIMQENSGNMDKKEDMPTATPITSEPTPIDSETLMKEGNKMINLGKYEEAIGKMSEALQLAIAQTGSELEYSLAKYYYAYGDSIIAKLSNSTEIFGDAIQEAIDKKGGELVEESKAYPEEDEKAPQEDSKEKFEEEKVEPQIHEEEKVPANPPAGEEPAEDIQIAWESMETARVICEKKLSELSAQKDSVEYKEAAKTLARIYMSIGEILAMQEREEDALAEFKKALDLRVETEGKNSRELAETYFTIGSTTLHFKGKEREAIENLFNAVHIIESCLCELIGLPHAKNVEEHKAGEMDFVKNDLVKVNPMDSKEVKELKEVLMGVYARVILTLSKHKLQVEDAVLQEKELPELKKVLETEQAEKPKEEGFDKQMFPEDKVQDLGVLGRGKKRVQEENKKQIENGATENKRAKVEEDQSHTKQFLRDLLFDCNLFDKRIIHPLVMQHKIQYQQLPFTSCDKNNNNLMKGKFKRSKALESLFCMLDSFITNQSIPIAVSVTIFLVEHLELLSFIVCEEVIQPLELKQYSNVWSEGSIFTYASYFLSIFRMKSLLSYGAFGTYQGVYIVCVSLLFLYFVVLLYCYVATRIRGKPQAFAASVTGILVLLFDTILYVPFLGIFINF